MSLPSDPELMTSELKLEVEVEPIEEVMQRGAILAMTSAWLQGQKTKLPKKGTRHTAGCRRKYCKF